MTSTTNDTMNSSSSQPNSNPTSRSPSPYNTNPPIPPVQPGNNDITTAATANNNNEASRDGANPNYKSYYNPNNDDRPLFYPPQQLPINYQQNSPAPPNVSQYQHQQQHHQQPQQHHQDLNPDRLKSLIMTKESELHQITEYRISTLQKLLNEKDLSNSELESRFAKLKEDFHYNLNLVSERDLELERYESLIRSLEENLRKRDLEINDIRAELAGLIGSRKANEARF